VLVLLRQRRRVLHVLALAQLLLVVAVQPPAEEPAALPVLPATLLLLPAEAVLP
jgi:hypothetical protein